MNFLAAADLARINGVGWSSRKDAEGKHRGQ
jgi:hypothetical protein